MPNAKNNLKLTGDTHLPDVGFEPIEEDTTMEMLVLVPEDEGRPRVYADGWVPPEERRRPEREPGPARAAVQKVEALEAKSPWLAIGVGLAFGWLVARMMRR